MAAFTETDMAVLLADQFKCILADIAWSADEDHSPAVEFFVNVENSPGYPLIVRGSFNHEAETMTFALVHRGVGRIYGLDLGKEHKNPSDNKLVGELHKHRWTDAYRDKVAYRPDDITAGVDDPVEVWKQFCQEAGINHAGTMRHPKPQRGLFDANQSM
jgi:hypothetical protein